MKTEVLPMRQYMMVREWKAYLAAAVLLISAAAVYSSGKGAGAPQEEGSVYASSSEVAATGRVEARREAKVCAKGAGRVLKYLKNEGDWVEEGSVVVLLDQGQERGAFSEADAELTHKSAFYKRLSRLHEERAVSDQEFEDARAGYELAKARREKAQAALDERVLRAPFSGKVLKTYLEAGESLPNPPADAPLFAIGDTRALKVRAEIDELDISRVVSGSPVRVYPDAYPDEVYLGKVARLSGMLGRKNMRSDDPRERMDAKVLEVEIELAASERLKPGSSVQVKIDSRRLRGGS